MTTTDRTQSPRPRSLCRVVRGFLAFVLSLALTLQWTSPASAFLGLGGFTIKDEVELGKKFDVLIKSRMPLVEDPEVKLYVQDIVGRLLAQVPPQPFEFNTNVLLHNSLNAFASPGGFIFVHTGLIMQMDHESEVAGVLAHELAHATQRHIASRIEKMQTTSILSMAGALAGAFLGGGSGKGAAMAGSIAAGQSAMLNYSRVDETEADEIGLRYLIAAGYRPDGMVGAFEKIRKKQWITGTDIPSYLSTHPAVNERINSLSARIGALPAEIRSRPQTDERFLRVRTICRARYGDPAVVERMFNEAPASNCLASLGKGILYARQNRVGEATEAFDKALQCNPKDQLVWREAGRFHYTKGDKARAAAMLQRATLMGPDDYMALFYYARLLADSGQAQKSYQYFNEVLRRLPEDAEVHYYYGRVLGSSGQLFRAYLHLAYSALYSNDKQKTESFEAQAKAQARTPEEMAELERFTTKYQDRKAFW